MIQVNRTVRGKNNWSSYMRYWEMLQCLRIAGSATTNFFLCLVIWLWSFSVAAYATSFLLLLLLFVLPGFAAIADCSYWMVSRLYGVTNGAGKFLGLNWVVSYCRLLSSLGGFVLFLGMLSVVSLFARRSENKIMHAIFSLAFHCS